MKNNPVVLCLHGLGSTQLSFIEVAEALKNDFYFISIDLPAHGKTAPFESEDDYRIDRIAEWVNDLCIVLDIKDFYLLAHSWGGQIAMFYYSKYFENVKKMLLIDGGYHIPSFVDSYNQANGTGLTSLEENIEFYRRDFDGYVFDTMESFIGAEKINYPRWSELLNAATMDLAVIKDNKYCWHVPGNIAEKCLTGIYECPPDLIYAKIKSSKAGNNILLLQAAIPENLLYRDILAEKFRSETGGVVKKMPLTHMMHWENPELVINEVREWFK
jgi:pimeloyl-ACP methyl ester carboxylesterase